MHSRVLLHERRSGECALSLFRAERLHGVDLRGAAGGEPAGEQGERGNEQGHAAEDHGIKGTDSGEQLFCAITVS